MRVIITGGTGLIGRELATSLLEDTHEVIVLTRTPELDKKLPVGVRVVGWDGRTSKGWEELIDSNTAIVNLAGASISKRWTDDYKAIIRESRIQAGHAIIEAIQAAGSKPRVLIQASAVGYYGPRKDETITETDTTSPENDFLASVCRDWESSTQEAESLGVRRAVIRTGVVISPEGGAFPRMVFPFKMFTGGPVGDGQQWFPWIHIADEINAIKFLLTNDQASGVFNLSAPHPLTNAKFGRVIGKTLNRPAILPVPAVIFQVVFGEMSSLLLTGQKVIPQRLLDAGFVFQYPEAEQALANLLKKH